MSPRGDPYLALVTPFTKKCDGKCLQNMHDTKLVSLQVKTGFFFPGPTAVFQSSKSNSSTYINICITFKNIGEKNCERNFRLCFFKSSLSWKNKTV